MGRQRRGSPLEAAAGIGFVVVAVAGRRFLGWRWGAPVSEQPVAFAVGALAAATAAFLAYRRATG